MKTIVSIFLCIIILVSLCSCQSKSSEKIIEPVNFYYCTKEIAYNSATGVISSETREAAPYEDDLTGLMNLYVKGPVSESLYSPFPGNGKVLQLTVGDDSTHIVLNSSFSGLTGVELTLFRACLAKTLMEITQSDIIQISVVSDNPGSRQTVTVRADNFIFSNEEIILDPPEE